MLRTIQYTEEELRAMKARPSSTPRLKSLHLLCLGMLFSCKWRFMSLDGGCG